MSTKTFTPKLRPDDSPVHMLDGDSNIAMMCGYVEPRVHDNEPVFRTTSVDQVTCKTCLRVIAKRFTDQIARIQKGAVSVA